MLKIILLVIALLIAGVLLNDIDLEGKLREAKEELFNLRFQAATGQLESPGRVRIVRRTIARIKTLQSARKAAAQPGA